MKVILQLIISVFICQTSIAQQGIFQEEWQERKFKKWSKTEKKETSYKVPQVTITIHPNDTITRVLPTIYGNNAAGYQKVTEGNSLEHLKSVGVTYMRLPGGNISNRYFWDGNIPNQFRKTDMKPPLSGKNDPKRISTDGFLKLAQDINAKPVICVNFSYSRYGTGEDALQKAAHYAANFVRYVNKEKKMNVKYWEVGNENYGPWQAGYIVEGDTIDGEKYGKGFCVFVDSMKAADPTIKVGAVAVMTTKPKKGYNNWTAKMLPHIENKADFLIIHEYFTPQSPNNYSSEKILQQIYKIKADAIDIQNLVEKHTSKSRNYFPITMTEYNIRQGSREISHVSGMFIAQAIGEYIKNNYGMVMLWNFQNGYDKEGGDHGMLARREPNVKDGTPHPSFFAYYYYSKYFGDALIKANSNDENIKVYASRFSSGELGLVIINQSNEDKSIEIKTPNFQRVSNMYWHSINANSLDDRHFYINDIYSKNNFSNSKDYKKIAPYHQKIKHKKISFFVKGYSINYIAITQ